jgi:hypothetical protein
MFEGDFKYYVPLSEKLLGFSYDKGQWILLEDVKILSEQAPVVDEARPELNLFPQDK